MTHPKRVKILWLTPGEVHEAMRGGYGSVESFFAPGKTFAGAAVVGFHHDRDRRLYGVKLSRPDWPAVPEAELIPTVGRHELEAAK